MADDEALVERFRGHMRRLGGPAMPACPACGAVEFQLAPRKVGLLVEEPGTGLDFTKHVAVIILLCARCGYFMPFLDAMIRSEEPGDGK